MACPIRYSRCICIRRYDSGVRSVKRDGPSWRYACRWRYCNAYANQLRLVESAQIRLVPLASLFGAQMKLRQLQCFCAVVDQGFNISRASAVLHATQPAIGKQLSNLESELGADLLLRQSGRLLGLTVIGERVLPWARRALQCSDNIRAAAQEGDSSAGGSIDLATTHTHARYVLLPAIVAFAQRYPKVQIGLQQGVPEQVAEMVRDGKVAFGVVHPPAQLPREIIAVPFFLSRLVLVTPIGHPLLKQKELTLEKLAGYPLIVQNPARPQGSRILAKFREVGLDVNLAVQALDADVMKTYVAAGLGIALIPAFTFTANLDRKLRIRDVDHLFGPTPSAVLLRRNSYLKHYVYAFLEQLDPELERRHVESLIFDSD
jgi:LysR family transcriptional regulator, cys regulon transcriptional activator